MLLSQHASAQLETASTRADHVSSSPVSPHRNPDESRQRHRRRHDHVRVFAFPYSLFSGNPPPLDSTIDLETAQSLHVSIDDLQTLLQSADDHLLPHNHHLPHHADFHLDDAPTTVTINTSINSTARPLSAPSIAAAGGAFLPIDLLADQKDMPKNSTSVASSRLLPRQNPAIAASSPTTQPPLEASEVIDAAASTSGCNFRLPNLRENHLRRQRLIRAESANPSAPHSRVLFANFLNPTKEWEDPVERLRLQKLKQEALDREIAEKAAAEAAALAALKTVETRKRKKRRPLNHERMSFHPLKPPVKKVVLSVDPLSLLKPKSAGRTRHAPTVSAATQAKESAAPSLHREADDAPKQEPATEKTSAPIITDPPKVILQPSPPPVIVLDDSEIQDIENARAAAPPQSQTVTTPTSVMPQEVKTSPQATIPTPPELAAATKTRVTIRYDPPSIKVISSVQLSNTSVYDNSRLNVQLSNTNLDDSSRLTVNPRAQRSYSAFNYPSLSVGGPLRMGTTRNASVRQPSRMGSVLAPQSFERKRSTRPQRRPVTADSFTPERRRQLALCQEIMDRAARRTSSTITRRAVEGGILRPEEVSRPTTAHSEHHLMMGWGLIAMTQRLPTAAGNAASIDIHDDDDIVYDNGQIRVKKTPRGKGALPIHKVAVIPISAVGGKFVKSDDEDQDVHVERNRPRINSWWSREEYSALRQAVQERRLRSRGRKNASPSLNGDIALSGDEPSSPQQPPFNSYVNSRPSTADMSHLNTKRAGSASGTATTGGGDDGRITPGWFPSSNGPASHEHDHQVPLDGGGEGVGARNRTRKMSDPMSAIFASRAELDFKAGSVRSPSPSSAKTNQ